MVKGKTLEEALALSRDAVAQALGGLPPHKMHCSNLAADALHAAIEDYFAKHPEARPPGWTPRRKRDAHDDHGQEPAEGEG
jgi:NifU-like protein involved in Fe-S cluster formation